MWAARWVLVTLAVSASTPATALQSADGHRGPAYLVYAGPYSSSPSSAFGHLFLVLANQPRAPPPLWNVVTFNAVTFGADPIRYLTVGVLGGFLGRFDRFAFHQKTRDYEVLDDRDLWLVELRLTDAERRRLEEAIDEASGHWYPYSFFELNCAHYLQRVLHEATGAIPPPHGVTTPTGVFGLVEASRLGGASFHRPSASRRLDLLTPHASAAVLERIRRDRWEVLAADVDWLGGLDGPERRLALELFGLRSLESDHMLPASTTAGLAHLRLLSAEPQDDLPGVPTVSGPGFPSPAPEFHGYQRLRLLLEARRHEPARLHLQARAAMHDETDPWTGQQPASTMELLAMDLSTPVRRPRLRFESAVVFSQRSLGASDWIRGRASWLLEALARRGGLFDGHALHGEVRGGLGRTLRLPGNTYVHGLVTLAGVGALDHGVGLAPGLEAGLVARTASDWRFGASWTGELDALSWSRRIHRAAAWTRLDLGSHWGVLLVAATDSWGRSAGVALTWVP